jgi:hypothetical protein
MRPRHGLPGSFGLPDGRPFTPRLVLRTAQDPVLLSLDLNIALSLS